MTNKEKYDQVFKDCFSISEKELTEDFVYQSIPEWDSVGHMGLIAALEDTFAISLETEDIIEFGSYTIGIDILKKYSINL